MPTGMAAESQLFVYGVWWNSL